MKVIIVDDDNLTLLKIEKLLHAQTELHFPIKIIGTYLNPHDALAAASQEVPDVAFLNTRQMQGIAGHELARQLLEMHPKMHIVFVISDLQSFSLEAFEVGALDYLPMPVRPSRLSITLNRIAQVSHISANQAGDYDIGMPMICCMQDLHYRDQHGNLQYFSWKTLKAPELFAYLIYQRNKTISKQALIDLLWPHQDIKKATAQLHTAIYQIRQMIKTCGLDLQINYHAEGYRLVWGEMAYDIEIWENTLLDMPPVTPETLPRHIEILGMSTGDYLEAHQYTWAEPERERIRMIWLKHAMSIGKCYMHMGKTTEAAKLYLETIRRLPYMEEGYAGLMKVHAKHHNFAKVKSIYQHMKDIFNAEYAIAPSEELTGWYHQITKTLASK